MSQKSRDRLYECYVSNHLTGESKNRLNTRSAYLRQLIKRHFPADRLAEIIELGCGYGALIHFAHLAGYSKTTGVDVSSEQIAEANKLGIPGVSQGELMDTMKNKGDKSVDMIIAFDVVEHLGKNEMLNLVDEVYRVLKPGGRWLIHTPNASSPFFGRIRYGDYTHEMAYTKSSIKQILRAGRFEKVACFEDKPVIHGIMSLMRYILWCVARSVFSIIIAAETGTGNEIFSQNFLISAKK